MDKEEGLIGEWRVVTSGGYRVGSQMTKVRRHNLEVETGAPSHSPSRVKHLPPMTMGRQGHGESPTGNGRSDRKLRAQGMGGSPAGTRSLTERQFYTPIYTLPASWYRQA